QKTAPSKSNKLPSNRFALSSAPRNFRRSKLENLLDHSDGVRANLSPASRPAESHPSTCESRIFFAAIARGFLISPPEFLDQEKVRPDRSRACDEYRHSAQNPAPAP